MIKRNTKRQLVINMFLLIIFTMGIGYAYLTSNLNINGTTEIAGNVWDIHFENIKVTDGSVIAVNPAIINSNKDSVTYSIKLERPKDYYEFTVDVVNAGTLPGKVSISNLSGIDSQYLNIIDYSIKYVGDVPVNVGDILNAGRYRKVKVRVFYKDDIQASDLPNNNINLNLTYTLQYVQSNEEDILPIIGTYNDILKTTYISDTYKDKIKTVTLKGEIEEPNNPVESWDIGEEQNGNVMAYLVTNSEDNTMYDLYIEGDGQLIANQDSTGLFSYLSNLEKINNLDIIDTSTTTNMMYMFFGDLNLQSIDLLEFDTSNVISMKGMFWGATSLKTIDVSSFNTSKVNDMYAMFGYKNGTMALEEIIGIEDFDTSNVENMHVMFQNCSNLIELDLSSWITDNVTDMAYMFNKCNKLETLDVSTWNTSSVTNMQYMFSECEKLKQLDVTSFNTINVETMKYMFYNCSTLTVLDVSDFDTRNVVDFEGMFYKCSNLTALDVSRFNTINAITMKRMFCRVTNVTVLDVSHFNTDKVTDMSYMFAGAISVEMLDVRSFNTSLVTDMTHMFGSNIISFNTSMALTEIKGIEDFNTGNVESMKYLFFGNANIEEFDLRSWNTSKVSNMEGVFAMCLGLKSLKVNTWDVSNVTDFYDAIRGTGLEELDLSNWHPDSMEISNRMFNSNHSLHLLDIRNFDFTIITDELDYYAYTFNGPYNNLIVTVKNQANKDWIVSHFGLNADNIIIAS